MGDYKKSIKAFVAGTWDEDDQERAEHLDDQACRQDQEALIEKLPLDLTMACCILRDLILRGKIKLLDKENMGKWVASGFFIDPNDEIVIFHER